MRREEGEICGGNREVEVEVEFEVEIGDSMRYGELMSVGLLFLLVNENENMQGGAYEHRKLAAGEKDRTRLERSFKTKKQRNTLRIWGFKDRGK
jgi:hypothetical protein